MHVVHKIYNEMITAFTGELMLDLKFYFTECTQGPLSIEDGSTMRKT